MNLSLRFLAALAVVACTWCVPAAAQQAFPNKPVHLLVPQAAGSATDAPARMLADSLKNTLGQPVVVENRVGAGGLLAINPVVRAAPDGYTLLFTSSTAAVQQAMNKDVGFDMRRDLVPVAIVAQGVLGLFVNASLPVKTTAELVAYAKARPGKLNYGSGGIGSTNHLFMEHFKTLVGIDVTHVPYNATQNLVMGAMSNDVQMLIQDVAYMRPHVQSGKLRLLGVATTKPSELAPEAPTVGGHDGIPPFEGTFFFGVFAPANTPPAVLDTLYRNIEQWWQDPATRRKLVEMGYEPVLQNPEVARKTVAAYIDRMNGVVERAGLRK